MHNDYIAIWAEKRREATRRPAPVEGENEMFTPSALLDAVIKTLVRDKGELVVTPWFMGAEALAIKENQLVISVSNELFRDTLTERFSSDIRTACRRITGKDTSPLFLCGEQAEQWRRENDETIYTSYTFERYIVGNSNKFAHAAALAVAKKPAALYNPLFIYGQSGLGKTHLLYAIAGEIRKNNKNFKIIYKKGDDFTNEIVEAIQNGTMADVRAHYRQADLLLVDDIQFIAGKERTQEEFFHTFNTLHEASKQVVLTSDRPPKEITPLADRLRTRFEAGLLADIQSPDLETRMALVVEKGELLGVKIPNNVVEYIAASITNNVREIEGVVKKLAANHSLMGKTIDLALAQEAIKDIYKERPGLNPTPQLILDEVAEYYNIPASRLLGSSRTKDIVVPRQITVYLIRELTEASLPDIGKFMNQHHTTILYAINKLTEQMSQQEELRNAIKDLKSNIQNK